MTRPPRRRERRADVDPERIDAALERFTHAHGLTPDLALVRIRESWPDVVGPILAPRSSAERLAGSTLHISCDHGTTANEITMLHAIIAQRAGDAGGQPVAQLDVRVRRPRRR